MVAGYDSMLTLGGVTIPKKLRWHTVDLPESDISTGTVIVTRSVFDLVPTLQEGTSVSITRGLVTPSDEAVFDGEVSKIEEFNGLVTLTIVDEMIKTINAEVTKTYTSADAFAGVGSEIFKDLINSYTDLTADDTSVVSTGTANIRTTFICNHASVYEKIKELCFIYNYIAYYSPTTGKVHFEPREYVTYGTALQVGVNIKNQLKWIGDGQQLINDFTVLGGELLVEDEVFFDGTGAQAEFTLPYKPVSVRVEVDSGSGFVLQTPGVEDSTPTGYDYVVDKEAPTITFQSGSEPTSGSNNVKVTIIRALPVPLRATDSASVGTYGRRRKTQHLVNVQGVTDAESYASAFVSKNKDPQKNTIIQTTETPVAGNLIRVIDKPNRKDLTLYIHRVEKMWPGRYTKLTVGEKMFRMTDLQNDNAERLKRLEELSAQNTQITVHKIEASSQKIALHSRPVTLSTEDRSADTLYIVNHPIRGALGGGYTYGDGTDTFPTTVNNVIWCQAQYKELFIDEDNLAAGTASVSNGVLQ